MRVALSSAGELSVVGPAADDWVRITRTGDAYELTSDRAPTLRVGGGCRRSMRRSAVCPLAGVTHITVVTREGLDQVLVGSVEPVPVPVAISTGPGHDYVALGVVGPATVDADGGDDYVMGGSGPDRLDGGDGDDQLAGGSGTDTLLGGAGDDLLEDMYPGPAPEADTLDCGPGVDMPRANLGSDVVLNCEQPQSEWSLWPSSSRIKYRLRRFRDGTTKFTRIRVAATREGSDVMVECHGRGCPSPTWRARQTTRYSLDALGPLAERRLPPQTRVTITVVSPRPPSMTKVVRLTTRRGRPPVLRVHCIGPISGIVTRAACRASGLPSPGRYGDQGLAALLHR